MQDAMHWYHRDICGTVQRIKVDRDDGGGGVSGGEKGWALSSFLPVEFVWGFSVDSLDVEIDMVVSRRVIGGSK
jgi:hypothetical protein